MKRGGKSGLAGLKKLCGRFGEFPTGPSWNQTGCCRGGLPVTAPKMGNHGGLPLQFNCHVAPNFICSRLKIFFLEADHAGKDTIERDLRDM